MAEWLPIETAPKDALVNSIVWDGRNVAVAFFDEDDGWLDACNHNGYQHAQLAPTHWMPLPDPPKQG